jgi:L-fuconolactonase
MVIDSHHHFWNYDPVAYDWIDDTMAAIRKDFGPAELRAEIAAAGVDGVVSVQARQSLEETEWLLGMAAENDFIKGVVGWVPLADPGIGACLDALTAAPKLKAVRHVVQGEADKRFLEREDFQQGIRELAPRGLVYDILIVERQLAAAIAFVDRHPNQVFVLDHIAKPLIKDGIFEPWATLIRELARRENVSCKVSGIVTESDWKAWTPEGIRPYVDTVLESFGTDRLLFGSDWPVCLVASGYGQWVNTVRGLLQNLSAAEQAQVFGGNACRVYSLV